MSYTPTTDFVALLRNAFGGERFTSIPGLDFVVAALARAGLINLFVGQTAPTVNQATTAWFLPSVPSWVAEGTLLLWNSSVNQYQVATPALWDRFFSASQFQSLGGAAGTVTPGTTLLAIQRTAPVVTAVQLPSIASQAGRLLRVVDWSTGVVNHDITLTASGTDTIMQQASWQLLSTAVQLAGIALYPSADLDGWIIAP